MIEYIFLVNFLLLMIIICYDDIIIVKGLVNMYKAFKFRIYPNAPQKSFINKSLGCSRFIYNYYLSMLKDNGYSKFKSKFSRNTYNNSTVYDGYKNEKYCNIEVPLNEHNIKISKLKWVKARRMQILFCFCSIMV